MHAWILFVLISMLHTKKSILSMNSFCFVITNRENKSSLIFCPETTPLLELSYVKFRNQMLKINSVIVITK